MELDYKKFPNNGIDDCISVMGHGTPIFIGTTYPEYNKDFKLTIWGLYKCVNCGKVIKKEIIVEENFGKYGELNNKW